MNIILITILLTLSGTCLVVYFIWLGVSLYKLMKFKKQTESTFKHLERWINDNYEFSNKRIDETYESLSKMIFDNTQTTLESFTKIDDTIVKYVNELDSKIDSRNDKLQTKLETLSKNTDRHLELSK